MRKNKFKLGDFVVIPVNGEYKIKFISNDKNDPNCVNLYYVNYVCRNEIIYKWQPTKNEICLFIDYFEENILKDKFVEMSENGFYVSENHIVVKTYCPCCAEKEPYFNLSEFKYCEPFLGQKKAYLLKDL